jgi:hypothetical protein
MKVIFAQVLPKLTADGLGLHPYYKMYGPIFVKAAGRKLVPRVWANNSTCAAQLLIQFDLRHSNHLPRYQKQKTEL